MTAKPQKRRLTISVDNDVYDAIKYLASVRTKSGDYCSMSSVINELLSPSVPIVYKIASSIEYIESLNSKPSQELKDILSSAQSDIEPLIKSLNQVFDLISPPPSNTGVTPKLSDDENPDLDAVLVFKNNHLGKKTLGG